MPRPLRAFGAMQGSLKFSPIFEQLPAVRDLLLSERLSAVVDLVASASGEEVEVGNAGGSVRFLRAAPYSVTAVAGLDPLANDDPLAFTPTSAEPFAPPSAANA